MLSSFPDPHGRSPPRPPRPCPNRSRGFPRAATPLFSSYEPAEKLRKQMQHTPQQSPRTLDPSIEGATPHISLHLHTMPQATHHMHAQQATKKQTLLNTPNTCTHASQQQFSHSPSLQPHETKRHHHHQHRQFLHCNRRNLGDAGTELSNDPSEARCPGVG